MRLVKVHLSDPKVIQLGEAKWKQLSRCYCSNARATMKEKGKLQFNDSYLTVTQYRKLVNEFRVEGENYFVIDQHLTKYS